MFLLKFLIGVGIVVGFIILLWCVILICSVNSITESNYSDDDYDILDYDEDYDDAEMLDNEGA